MLLTIIMWLSGAYYLTKLRKRIEELESKVTILTYQNNTKQQEWSIG